MLDLVTGQPVRNIDPLGRVTSYLYDDAGRQVSRTTPDGLTTTSTFARATPTTAASRTDTTPDGRVVLTTYDVLGRKVRVTDNVQDQAFTDSPTIRQLSAFDYSLDGTTVTATDQHGRTIHTLLDVLGRQVQPGRGDRASPTPPSTTTPPTRSPSQSSPTVQRTRRRRAPPATTTATGPSPCNATTATGPPTRPRRPPSTGSAGSPRRPPTISTLEYSYLGAGGASTTQTATPLDPGLSRGTVGSVEHASPSVGSRPAAPANTRRRRVRGDRPDLRPGRADRHLHRPQRSHHQLHLLSRRRRRHPHHPVGHRRHRHLRRHHRPPRQRHRPSLDRVRR